MLLFSSFISLFSARSLSSKQRFAMHMRVRDVVSHPTRPHGHCQLGDSHNLRHHPRQSTASPGSKWGKSTHNASRNSVHVPSLSSQGRRQTRTPQDTLEGNGEKVGGTKCVELQRGTPIVAINVYSTIYRYQFPLWSSHKKDCIVPTSRKLDE